MWTQLNRRAARGPVAVLTWALAVVAGASLSACKLDDRRTEVASPDPIVQTGNGDCDSSICVTVNPEQPAELPAELRCLPAGCPADDACRSYVDVIASDVPDAGCLTLADCNPTWKPAAREGAGCRCDENGCVLLLGETCSAAAGCEGGNCVATAEGGSVCCAQACAETEVCAPDGSGCAPAEPCTGEGHRCSGALHQGCVDGAWRTLTDCGALGCSIQLDSCLRAAGQACESDADCGEGTCLATADGNRVCCTGQCNSSCQRCSAAGTECANIDDDEACGPIECPTDPCRLYDPATVVTNRCAAGQCATPEQACTVFQPQRAGLECSATALCDEEGACARPKSEVLAACTSSEQCSSGACVATVAGTSVCCAQACAASEVCGPAGACVPAPVCDDDAVQCSGSNFQRCVAGQWATEAACGVLGCSVQRQGCLAGAGQACTANADCGQGTCQDTAAGGSVCCTAACGGACRVCAASGTVCTNLADDPACGAIDCPDDTTCRDFPASVTTQRCIAGACGSGAQLCQGAPRNVGQSCSADNLCDDSGNCAVPKLGLGQACGTASQCDSGNCVDNVCCNSACNDVCESCGTGFCQAAATDGACGTVTCSTFDPACVFDTRNSFNECIDRGRCRTTDDCGLLPGFSCGQGGTCDAQGQCDEPPAPTGPSVSCAGGTCSGGNACCGVFDFNSNAPILGCGIGADCSGIPGFGAGPTMQIFCDDNDDCAGRGVCCMLSTNVNSGFIDCRFTCTAEALGAELGAPPEMLVVGQLCASEIGQFDGTCDCSLGLSTLPGYVACR